MAFYPTPTGQPISKPVYPTPTGAPIPKPVYPTPTGAPITSTTGTPTSNPLSSPTAPKLQSTPIDASIIGNTKPIDIASTQVNDTTASNALQMTNGAISQPENTQITEPPTPDPASTSGSGGIVDKLKSLIGIQSTQGDVASKLQNEQGLSDKEIALNDINKKITSTKKAYDEQIKNLRKNFQGTVEGLNAEIGVVTRQGNEDLANLAIIQAGAQGDVNTANDIIQKKLDAEFEPIKNEIESYTNLYNLVQNDLSESEKLAIQNNIDQKKTSASELLNAKKDAYQTALSNGAPASVLAAIGKATSPDEAYQSVGSYGVDALDRAYKIAQINSLNNANTENGTITGKPQTASQSAANLYGDRLNQANISIDQLGANFTGKLAKFPLPNFLKTSDRQVYEQAKLNFVTAVLRRESGAAISPSEFKDADKQYFPQPGDGAGVIANKQTLRNNVINNFYKEANVLRPVLPGQVVESGGKRYKVGSDGETLTELK